MSNYENTFRHWSKNIYQISSLFIHENYSLQRNDNKTTIK